MMHTDIPLWGRHTPAQEPSMNLHFVGTGAAAAQDDRVKVLRTGGTQLGSWIIYLFFFSCMFSGTAEGFDPDLSCLSLCLGQNNVCKLPFGIFCFNVMTPFFLSFNKTCSLLRAVFKTDHIYGWTWHLPSLNRIQQSSFSCYSATFLWKNCSWSNAWVGTLV